MSRARQWCLFWSVEPLPALTNQFNGSPNGFQGPRVPEQSWGFALTRKNDGRSSLPWAGQVSGKLTRSLGWKGQKATDPGKSLARGTTRFFVSTTVPWDCVESPWSHETRWGLNRWDGSSLSWGRLRTSAKPSRFSAFYLWLKGSLAFHHLWSYCLCSYVYSTEACFCPHRGPLRIFREREIEQK